MKNLDVAFLIDESASIPEADFEEVKGFADATIGLLAKSDTSMRFGLIEFSDEAG
jgi:hypothetical protein